MTDDQEEKAKSPAPAPLEGEWLAPEEDLPEEGDEEDPDEPRAPRRVPRPDRKLIRAMEKTPVIRRGWERIEANYQERPNQSLPPAHMANSIKDSARMVSQHLDASQTTADETDYSHRLFPAAPALAAPPGESAPAPLPDPLPAQKERALEQARGDVAPERIFLAWSPIEGGGLSAQLAWEAKEGAPLRTRAIEMRPGPGLAASLGAFRAALDGKDAFVWETPPLFRAISALLADDPSAQRTFEPLHLWLKATTAKSLCAAVYSVPHEMSSRLDFAIVARRMGVTDLSNAYPDAPLAARLLRVQRRLQKDLLRKRDGLPVDPLDLGPESEE